MDLFLLPPSVLLSDEVRRLTQLVAQFKQEPSLLKKLLFLTKEESVSFLYPKIVLSAKALTRKEELVIKSVIAIRQEKIFENGGEKKKELLQTLIEMESFYEEIGGIVGYHLTLLQLLCQSGQRFSLDKSFYHAPQGIDLSKMSLQVKEVIYHAIERMGELSEMYPVGGAADRLNLQDPITGSSLPLALLPFKT